LGLFCTASYSQHYLRGEIKDESDHPLANVKILFHSSGYVYYSGNSGGFGITMNKPVDSVSFMLDGYQTFSTNINAGQYQQITLKMLRGSMSVQKIRLISVTKDLKNDDRRNWGVGGESYSNLVENDFIPAQKFPVTGFALNIDKAAYSNIRRFLNLNSQVPPDAVRIEEMLNYFNFDYTAPPPGEVFNVRSKLTASPWSAGNQLLYLTICARKVDLEKVAPSNLVFLVDVSGSMDLPNRLPLLKAAFRLMVNNLRNKDTVSIVTYGGTTAVVLQPTSGSNKQKIIDAMEGIEPGGSTPGESGIRTAYRLAKSQFIKGGNNRVIIATDGDFNVGQTSDRDLEELITQHQQSGIYLTCLGVGMGNYKDSKLEVLAKKGNGNFAYLDNEREAEKVLVKEMTQTLYTVADDVYMNVFFNPAYVKEYRLVGFDNKANAIADSTTQLEGGEIGSGHTLVALFEIEPVRDQAPDAQKQGVQVSELASLQLNYKFPNDTIWHKKNYTCSTHFTEFSELESCQRFAAAVAMFGSLLRNSRYTKNISWTDIEELAAQSATPGEALHQEFITLVQKAKKLYTGGKKKKKDRD
jgi:Ca-activated chloride channel homolog